MELPQNIMPFGTNISKLSDADFKKLGIMSIITATTSGEHDKFIRAVEVLEILMYDIIGHEKHKCTSIELYKKSEDKDLSNYCFHLELLAIDQEYNKQYGQGWSTNTRFKAEKIQYLYSIALLKWKALWKLEQGHIPQKIVGRLGKEVCKICEEITQGKELDEEETEFLKLQLEQKRTVEGLDVI